MAGVAAGLADHLGVSVWVVRAAFVVLSWVNGAGLIGYVLLWWFLPLRQDESSPGLESAARTGKRMPTRPGAREVAIATALVVVGAGVMLLLISFGRGGTHRFVVPLVIAAIGVALVWRQLDDRAVSQWMRQTSGTGFVLRVVAGVACVALAAAWVVGQERGWNALSQLVGALVVAFLGVGLLVGPWVFSLWGELRRERAGRIRSQERADVAAHLHDSVLQTLALLQTQAADPGAVRTLARRQERELREWLFGDDGIAGESLVAAVRAVAGDVEADHLVQVDVASAGDAPINAELAPLVAAAREAIVNAAKHAGVDRVDVFVEVEPTLAHVYVRDRGVGFDRDAVPADRQGVRGSIVERLERHGGAATIRTAPGEGVEIHVSLPLLLPTTGGTS